MSNPPNPGFVIQLRRDTTAQWFEDNPVLAVGETGWDTDLRRVKLGDGVTAWNDLPYAADEAADVDAEKDRAEAAEADLQNQIDAIVGADLTQCVARSTDGSFGLPTPTGVGFEAVITGNALQDFNLNGVSL